MTQYRFTRHACVLIAAGILTMTACGESNDQSDDRPSADASATPSQSSTATPSPSKPDDPDEAAALKRYRESWEAQIKAFAQADSKGTDLKKNTSLHALAVIESDLMSMKEMGQVTKGRPVIKPKVTSMKKKDGIPVATITDCVDVSGWKLIDKKTQKEIALPSERLTRFESTSKVEDWGEHGWMVTKVTEEAEEC